jgi:hypothetical protein
MKSLPFILLALAMLSLAGCTGGETYLIGSAIGIWETKPAEKPPADTADQIAQHESWCYETLGYAECYTQAQNTEPDRLINVDPQSRYPLTNHNYWEVVYADK